MIRRPARSTLVPYAARVRCGRDQRAGGGGGGGGAGAVGGGDKRLQGEADIGGGDGVARVGGAADRLAAAAAAVALQPRSGEGRGGEGRRARRAPHHSKKQRDGTTGRKRGH